MVELFDHVAVHLDVVALGLDLAHLLLVQLQMALQLGRNHLHELVVRLLLLLRPLGGHASIISYTLQHHYLPITHHA